MDVAQIAEGYKLNVIVAQVDHYKEINLHAWTWNILLLNYLHKNLIYTI